MCRGGGGRFAAMVDLIPIVRALARRVDALEFSAPVSHVYDPLVYARRATERYLERYAKRGVEALFLGMNPGPFGMAQTGVPFGEVSIVRDWLGIEEAVGKPAREHPKRPIEGFACRRSEVSGQRLWGFARDRFTTPDRFFARFFVWNYCPLVFMNESGGNVTPDKLRAIERDALLAICDDALREFVTALAPARVIGIGEFAAKRARAALHADGKDRIKIDSILHPSPASPAANRGWARQVARQLGALGLAF
jgi:single-strand selective monofunctional uracil DNA glycosylase